MTDHSVVQLISLAIIVATPILIYVVNRIYAICRIYVLGCGQIATVTAAYEIRQPLQQILASTAKIDRSLHDQRRVLYGAHKRISTVTKGIEKPVQ